MSKKAPKNSYFYFMLDFKAEEEKKGRKFPGGLADVSQAASERWGTMDANQRAFYDARAKKDKGLSKSDPSTKELKPADTGRNVYCSQGIKLSEIDKKKLESERKEQYMKNRIAEYVDRLALHNAIAEEELFFIMGNYFCVHNEAYIPAELAIGRFSFAKGVIKKYHIFLNPCKIPLGYAFEAKAYSDETHQIPCPPNAMGDKDFECVFQRILEIVEPNGRGNQKPMMFVGGDEKNVTIINSFFRQFSNDYNRIDVFPLTHLFLAIKLKIKQDEMCNLTIARILLERDPFDNCRDIACKFHEEVDATRFCALSFVMRWCYLMADHICRDLGIRLIAGKHLPTNADINFMCSSFSNVCVAYNKNAPSTTSCASSSEFELDEKPVSKIVSIPELHSVIDPVSSKSDSESVFSQDYASELSRSKVLVSKKEKVARSSESSICMTETSWWKRSHPQVREPDDASFDGRLNKPRGGAGRGVLLSTSSSIRSSSFTRMTSNRDID